MLRRTPATPLVCLVVFALAFVVNSACASDPQEALDILLKPNKATAAPAAASTSKAAHRAAPIHKQRLMARAERLPEWPPVGITKVKAMTPPQVCGVGPAAVQCVLPKPMQGQWELTTQALFARTKGTIAWPRVSWYYYSGYTNEVDLNGDMGIPEHAVIPEVTLSYQFRPNWALRYSFLGTALNGGNANSSRPFVFGNSYNYYFGYGGLNSKWEHNYQKVGLVYDPIKTCTSRISLEADWVHSEDKITLNCVYCGYGSTIFSRSGDYGMVAAQIQNCLKTAPNGGALSLDCKAGVIFYDDSEGWDAHTALKFSIPLGCGRWGYMKGGYRFINIKKSQPDLLFCQSMEGGFAEAGFVF